VAGRGKDVDALVITANQVFDPIFSLIGYETIQTYRRALAPSLSLSLTHTHTPPHRSWPTLTASTQSTVWSGLYSGLKALAKELSGMQALNHQSEEARELRNAVKMYVYLTSSLAVAHEGTVAHETKHMDKVCTRKGVACRLSHSHSHSHTHTHTHTRTQEEDTRGSKGFPWSRVRAQLIAAMGTLLTADISRLWPMSLPEESLIT
jgi:hypothetical protein